MDGTGLTVDARGHTVVPSSLAMFVGSFARSAVPPFYITDLLPDEVREGSQERSPLRVLEQFFACNAALFQCLCKSKWRSTPVQGVKRIGNKLAFIEGRPVLPT